MMTTNSTRPTTRWTKKTNWLVIKLGGSLLSPHETSAASLREEKLPFDTEYARKLLHEIEGSQTRCVLVVGGGFLNRWYLQQVKQMGLTDTTFTNDLHTIGMAASDVNASVFRMLASEVLGANQVFPHVVKYEEYEHLEKLKKDFGKYQVVVAAGWKTGHSHDVDALMFGSLFKEKQIFSFKNIDGIYSADPKKDPTATKIKKLTWKEYREIINASEHTPGASFPIDAVAAQLAEKIGLGVAVIDGRDFRAVQEVFTEETTTRGSIITN